MSVFNVIGGQLKYLVLNAVRVLLTCIVFIMANIFELQVESTIAIFSVTLSLYYLLLIRMVFATVRESC